MKSASSAFLNLEYPERPISLAFAFKSTTFMALSAAESSPAPFALALGTSAAVPTSLAGFSSSLRAADSRFPSPSDWLPSSSSKLSIVSSRSEELTSVCRSAGIFSSGMVAGAAELSAPSALLARAAGCFVAALGALLAAALALLCGCEDAGYLRCDGAEVRRDRGPGFWRDVAGLNALPGGGGAFWPAGVLLLRCRCRCVAGMLVLRLAVWGAPLPWLS
jgi:hypothetical protein